MLDSVKGTFKVQGKGAVHNTSNLIMMHHWNIARNNQMQSEKYGEFLRGQTQQQFPSM